MNQSRKIKMQNIISLLLLMVSINFYAQMNDNEKPPYLYNGIINTSSQIISFNDTVQGEFNDDANIAINYTSIVNTDYKVEHESNIPTTDSYAKERGIHKGQVYWPCINKQQHDYFISQKNIIAIITLKYNMTVYDKTDYIFTNDTIFEIHTSTSNAGIFLSSQIKAIPQKIDFVNDKIEYPKFKTKSCNFNHYLFNLTLNFCRNNKLKIRNG